MSFRPKLKSKRSEVSTIGILRSMETRTVNSCSGTIDVSCDSNGTFKLAVIDKDTKAERFSVTMTIEGAKSFVLRVHNVINFYTGQQPKKTRTRFQSLAMHVARWLRAFADS